MARIHSSTLILTFIQYLPSNTSHNEKRSLSFKLNTLNEYFILTNKVGCIYIWHIILEKFKGEYCSIFRMQLSRLDWKFRNMNDYLSICQVLYLSLSFRHLSCVSMTVERSVWWFYLTTFVDNHVSKVWPWNILGLICWIFGSHSTTSIVNGYFARLKIWIWKHRLIF